MAAFEGRRRVVMVGGGCAGAFLAKNLQYIRKEYFEIPWASLRTKVQPSVAQRSAVDHSEYFVKGQLVTSAVVDIREDGVVTADGNVYAYDYLIITTGHSPNTSKAST